MAQMMKPIPFRPRLSQLIRDSIAAFEALSPEEQAKHREAQRQSWVRGMTARCEHGMVDFEQCPACRGWTK
jgi:hypothetical protein